MSFTVGSLFDGSGGFPLAAFMCGGVPIWASEIEPYPIAVTKSRFPYVKHLGSVTDIKGNEIDPVDVITFGSPCQDLSVAGKRAGLKHTENGDDETTRSGLFMEAVRIIKEMREATGGKYPRFAVWENVPGAFSSNKGEDFRVVCEELIKIVEPSAVMPPVPKAGWAYADHYCGDGWSLAYRVLDAQFWGVPQRRRRIYLVVDFGGERAGEILFKCDGLRGYFEKGRAPWQGITGNAENGAGATDYEGECLGYCGSFLPQKKAESMAWSTEDISCTLHNGACAGFQNDGVLETIDSHILDDQGGSRISVRNDGKCPTLRGETHGNLPCVMEAAGFKELNSAKAYSDGYEHEIAPCLSANKHDASVCVKNQYLFENHSQDTRYRGPLDVCPIVSATFGMGGNNQPFVVENTICIDGDKIGKAERAGGSGLGVRCGDKMYTLTAKDAGTHAVAYGIGNGQANQPVMEEMVGALNCMHDQQAICAKCPQEIHNFVAENNSDAPHQQDLLQTADGVCRTLAPGTHAMGSHLTKTIINMGTHYIVRRLTPTECARLQGFPDDWGHPDKKIEFTDEEYEFWTEVYETHQRINGKIPKPMNRDRLLRWYNKLHTDSSEYKMWGNGIALPNALYVMQGIANVYK